MFSPAINTTTGHHPCMASPLLERLLHHYQQLGVAPSTRRTYPAEVRALQQFCKHFNIKPFPASPLTLHYFCYLAQKLSHDMIKIYLAGIHLEHIENHFPDPTEDVLLRLLCTGIKRVQANKKRTRLLITIAVLCTLK